VDEREAVEYLRGRGWICLTAEAQLGRERGLAALYENHSLAVALVCDQVLDTSGALLGRVRALHRSGGSPHKHGESDLFDPRPGDGYPDGPVDSQGDPLDIGPPAPGEWNEDEYPNPEIGMKC